MSSAVSESDFLPEDYHSKNYFYLTILPFDMFSGDFNHWGLSLTITHPIISYHLFGLILPTVEDN